MNSKRRAELQRKLSMGAVPRPPADLFDRIKADIPQYLQTETDRARFTGSVAFSMRVAASILLLITTAFVTLRLLEPASRENAAFAPKPQLVPAVAHYQPATDAARAAQPAGEEVRLDIAQEPAVPSSIPAAPRVVAAPQVAEGDRENKDGRQQSAVGLLADAGASNANAAGARESADFDTMPAPEPEVEAATEVADLRKTNAASDVAAAPSASAGANAGFAPEPPSEPARTEAAPQTAQSLPITRERTRDRRAKRAREMAPALEPAPPPTAGPPPEPITVTASAPSLMSEAYADELSLKQKAEVFGISVDPNVFLDMKAALQRGSRPAASRVNVDALVNYFAGPPARPPRRGVSLEVEASPAPVEAEGDHAVLRFTIDTPRSEVSPRASTPPAAVDARIEIQMDNDAVASFHRIGGDAFIAAESTLLNNLSVTGLYELDLRPHLKASQHVATVRLRYRSIADGKENVITRVVHGTDLAHDWAHASRRHRLASLGAVWSESLKTAESGSDVAKRAEELATQEPDDSRARELANAASATSGGRK
jgi:hypothetical protein